MTTAQELAQKLDKPPAKPETFPAMLQAWKAQIELALPRHLSADRMCRIALTCFRTTPRLGDCDPTSVFAAVIQAAQLGLEPGLNGRAYIIPYGTTATFVPGWKGLVELCNRSGRASVWTGAVFEGDEFKWGNGSKPFVDHLPGDEFDAAKLTHAYAVGWVRGAEWPVIEVWSRAKIEKHRDRYNRVGRKHYSYEHAEMYARKVVLLQVLKYLPSTPELEAAIILNDQAEIGEQRITLDDAIRGEFAPIPEAREDATVGVAETASSASESEAKLTTQMAIDRIGAMTDADTISLWVDDLPSEIKNDEAFGLVYRTRLAALREAPKRGRK